MYGQYYTTHATCDCTRYPKKTAPNHSHTDDVGHWVHKDLAVTDLARETRDCDDARHDVDLAPAATQHHTVVNQVDVTFPHMPCAWLSLDTVDISGKLHLDAVGTTT